MSAERSSASPQPHGIGKDGLEMDSSHRIFVSVDEETHRRARIRADQLELSVPELAASALASAVETVELSEHAPEEALGDDHPGVDDLIQQIRADYPDFRAADNLTKDQLYDGVGRGGS